MAFNCFTVDLLGLARTLITQVQIGLPFDPVTSKEPTFSKTFVAIWDTGATGSVIMQKVINELGLKDSGIKTAIGVDGEHLTKTYLVSIGLPNRVGFPSVRVTSGKVLHADVLIGMDIISHGDFSVTNYAGKTCFSFRIPSLERIDLGIEPKKASDPIPDAKPPIPPATA
jgi:hypothetical protein